MRTGMRYKYEDKEYIVCRPDGLYYLININTGGTWSEGLEYDEFIRMIENDGLKPMFWQIEYNEKMSNECGHCCLFCNKNNNCKWNCFDKDDIDCYNCSHNL